jgi:DNA/RNA-binding domain of Phe-tRNA-synthetase-like protein
LDTLILTAGHDVAQLEAPVLIDIAREGDEIIQMGGNRKDVPGRDMVMRDARGVACTILRGQDNRSPISRATTHVLYVSYVPEEVSERQVRVQLELLEKHVRLFATGCHLEQSTILSA